MSGREPSLPIRMTGARDPSRLLLRRRLSTPNNERRDADLRSDNHFDADANPTVTFRSTKVTRFAGDSLTVAGNLTIHGITRPVVLRGHFNGMTGAPGKRRAGFDAETTINRKDFNMNWNRIVEGSAMVGDEVRIEIDIAAVEQPR